MNKRLYLDWKVGHTENLNSSTKKFVKATVPGAVQLDWANANDYPDYRVGDN